MADNAFTLECGDAVLRDDDTWIDEATSYGDDIVRITTELRTDLNNQITPSEETLIVLFANLETAIKLLSTCLDNFKGYDTYGLKDDVPYETNQEAADALKEE